MPHTKYIWDPLSDNVLMEKDENGGTKATNTYLPELYGDLISQRRDGESSYYHFDGQGNTRALTDENEDVTDTYTYTAFGEEVSKTGTTENPYRYVGEKEYYFDAETDDYYVRARTYAPRASRWIAVDPILFDGGSSNLYLYVANNPANLYDSSGLRDPDEWNMRTNPPPHVVWEVTESVRWANIAMAREEPCPKWKDFEVWLREGRFHLRKILWEHMAKPKKGTNYQDDGNHPITLLAAAGTWLKVDLRGVLAVRGTIDCCCNLNVDFKYALPFEMTLNLKISSRLGSILRVTSTLKQKLFARYYDQTVNAISGYQKDISQILEKAKSFSDMVDLPMYVCWLKRKGIVDKLPTNLVGEEKWFGAHYLGSDRIPDYRTDHSADKSKETDIKGDIPDIPILKTLRRIS